jgi:Peptidyl-tRNA hydrolase PTH2
VGVTDSEPGWVLPIVMHVDRQTPPFADDVLAAVGSAVAKLCAQTVLFDGDDPRRIAFDAWRYGGSIAKVARRARASEWRKVATWPSVLYSRLSGADVRVGWPHLANEVPVEIKQAQIAATDLEWRPVVDGMPSSPYLLVILLAKMTTGKAAAQVGHAAQLALEAAPDLWRDSWADGGFRVHVVRVMQGDPLPIDGPVVEVVDSGRTEVTPGTMTVAAWMR